MSAPFFQALGTAAGGIAEGLNRRREFERQARMDALAAMLHDAQLANIGSEIRHRTWTEQQPHSKGARLVQDASGNYVWVEPPTSGQTTAPVLAGVQGAPKAQRPTFKETAHPNSATGEVMITRQYADGRVEVYRSPYRSTVADQPHFYTDEQGNTRVALTRGQRGNLPLVPEGTQPVAPEPAPGKTPGTAPIFPQRPGPTPGVPVPTPRGPALRTAEVPGGHKPLTAAEWGSRASANNLLEVERRMEQLEADPRVAALPWTIAFTGGTAGTGPLKAHVDVAGWFSKRQMTPEQLEYRSLLELAGDHYIASINRMRSAQQMRIDLRNALAAPAGTRPEQLPELVPRLRANRRALFQNAYDAAWERLQPAATDSTRADTTGAIPGALNPRFMRGVEP